jgi:hypothetical protein
LPKGYQILALILAAQVVEDLREFGVLAASAPSGARTQTRYTFPVPQSTWLFVKDGQSVWVERVSTHSMLVAGPAAAREEHTFPDEDALQAFQVSLGERLTKSGWFLWGFDRERRGTTDDRAVATPDRSRRRDAD